MSCVIQVDNLGKRYRLGVINRGMLYKDLQSWWAKFCGHADPHAPIHHPHGESPATDGEFWAFRGVGFQLNRGEILGVVGRNGAGKSTLLKVLSQITAPTEGKFQLKGKVASLLEVGTGFHGELTGRENIYLNGAILGMSRADVRSCFDQIVDFAEVGQFVDTPVKRYSSGMYVRLAFSVAAHLQPDILIVDEVLAVGDAAFQKKCLGRMDEAAYKEGRTILFVSHNMTSVRSLCTRALLLKGGRLAADGPAPEIVDLYLGEGLTSVGDIERSPHEGSGRLRVNAVQFEAKNGGRIEELPVGSPVVIRIFYKTHHIGPDDAISVGIGVTDGTEGIFNNFSNYSGTYFRKIPHEGSFAFLWPSVDLVPGHYNLVVRVLANGDHHTGELLDMPPAMTFSVGAADFHGSGRNAGLDFGTVLVRGEWSMEIQQ